MKKPKPNHLPNWVRNLRALMEKNGFNPRSLSLEAGLNATAVRDIMEGRSRFPRYDTTLALADALDTTPAVLMSDGPVGSAVKAKGIGFTNDIELLTETITRLQEVATELNRQLPPRDLAAMAATIFQRLQEVPDRRKDNFISTQVRDLLDYESLRQKRKRS